MSPLVPVDKILDSPGGMQVRIAKMDAEDSSLFTFTYNGRTAVGVNALICAYVCLL